MTLSRVLITSVVVENRSVAEVAVQYGVSRRHHRLPRRPYKTLADIEYAVAGWVDWYNHRRLHGSLGMLTPTEYEQAHYAAPSHQQQPTLQRHRTRDGSTSASSTPPPANSFANSSSTPPSAAKAPDAHPDSHAAETKDGRTHHYWVRPSGMS
jgi:hypothetical protein